MRLKGWVWAAGGSEEEERVGGLDGTSGELVWKEKEIITSILKILSKMRRDLKGF